MNVSDIDIQPARALIAVKKRNRQHKNTCPHNLSILLLLPYGLSVPRPMVAEN